MAKVNWPEATTDILENIFKPTTVCVISAVNWGFMVLMDNHFV